MGLSLLDRLHLINVESCVSFIRKCKNFDEAFGVCENAESHAGQTFCCVATLKLLNRLEQEVDVDKLGW
jgi:geranylgeranyl transferase type-2 subunit beta